VRLNALKHGLLSKETLLPGEDEEALTELGVRLRDELQPVGVLESLLVERIVCDYWRLIRLGRVEAGIFAWERFEVRAEQAEREAGQHEELIPVDGGIFSLEPEVVITDEKKHEEALDRARRMRNEQEDETATLGRTFARDAERANAFTKLSRYETAIERGVYRALHELQRLQASRRADGNVPPPAAIDVDVSGVAGDRP
jgi:F0F1-type ATP synthase epsilon subunit